MNSAFPRELTHYPGGLLPARPGVLVVMCRGRSGNRRLLDKRECPQSIRAEAVTGTGAWAACCDGYLEYWIFESDDPAARQWVLAGVSFP